MGGEPTLSRAFCNQSWEYYPHKGTMNQCVGPQGIGPSSNWPTSVLCVADGRRSCPDESSWSPPWKTCSRLGKTTMKYVPLTRTSYLRPCQEPFNKCHREHQYNHRNKACIDVHFSKMLLQPMHLHLYIAQCWCFVLCGISQTELEAGECVLNLENHIIKPIRKSLLASKCF